jgi:MFS family permease
MRSVCKGSLCVTTPCDGVSPAVFHSYIGTSYLLSSTVFLPFFASVADVYGRYFGFQASLLLFLIGNAVSTGAVNIAMVLAGRGVAGIGAAGLLTVCELLVSPASLH